MLSQTFLNNLQKMKQDMHIAIDDVAEDVKEMITDLDGQVIEGRKAVIVYLPEKTKIKSKPGLLTIMADSESYEITLPKKDINVTWEFNKEETYIFIEKK
jgi:hypothetical protein